MKRVNYHTHTDYCGHAKGKTADYAAEAFRQGVEILGFSDHMPFPGDAFGSRMLYGQIEDYLWDVQALKEEYQGRMKILCGFEAEYIPGQEAYYEELLGNGACEYLVLGQHMFWDEDGVMRFTGEALSTKQYLQYVQNVLAGMKTGYFKVIAHPDLIFMNRYAWDENCEAACDLLVEVCEANDFALEWNANGIRRGIHSFDDGERWQYPHQKLWEKVAGTSIRVIVGSDCHNPKLMWDEAVKMSWEKAAAMGLNLVTEL